MGRFTTPKKKKRTPNTSPYVRVKVTPTPETPKVTPIWTSVNVYVSTIFEKPSSTANPEWLQARIQVSIFGIVRLLVW